jgi:polyadenylate-binding protein
LRDLSEKSKDFDFVSYKNAHKAMEEMNEKEIGGKDMLVDCTQKKVERQNELKWKFEQFKQEIINTGG